MKINHSRTMMFFVVWIIIVVHLYGVCNASRRIFDTAAISANNGAFDCLSIRPSARLSMDNRYLPGYSFDFRREIWQYCRRSTLSNSQQTFSRDNLTKTNYSAFTFDQLRSTGVTDQQLFKWYAPTDLIEEYITGEQSGLFINCSDTVWFGSKCEYTLDSDEELLSIINDQFDAKDSVPSNLSLYTNGTCYEMNNTACESIICLDWREICDGKIDCKNGYDERYCQQLEMNECNSSTERRCYDGQCIDDPQGSHWLSVRCSEEYAKQREYYQLTFCYGDYGSQCENQKCPRLFFSCGDGYCYDGPSISKRSCPTQRDRRYLEQMPTLSSFILFSYLIVHYNNTQPEYICYNQTLCPYLSFNNQITTIHDKGLTCRAFETFTNQTYDKLDRMVKDVKRLVRSCSLLPLEYNDAHHDCSIFRCHDGSKCLSFHRLSDGIEDCTNAEDEGKRDVCSRDLPGRFICDNGINCISEQLIYDGQVHCNDQTDEKPFATVLTGCSNPFSPKYCRMGYLFYALKVEFSHICNGLVEYGADLNNNTDESDCLTTEWPCDTYFFKCDGAWNCPDGRDELGCNVVTRSSLYCNNSQHFCLQINTGEPTCLSTLQASDGIIDCVGSFDEREFCRTQHLFQHERRYRCRNSTTCIYVRSICDGKQDCSENDDETTACDWFYNGQKENYVWFNNGNCRGFEEKNYDGRSDLFCDLSDRRDYSLWSKHHREKSSSLVAKYRFKRQSKENLDYSVIWSCNRGIYVRSTKDPEGCACFCPDYYYGDRCQYQRKRVSIQLQIQMLTAFNYHISTSIFIVLLIHTNKSNTTIISHVQFIHIPLYVCIDNFSMQLLYPIDEPYRSLTNHSVHVHMFDKQTHEYQMSWTFSLPFEFLPVQHLYKRLDIPELGTNVESKQIFIPYSSCSSCANHSLCIGHDVTLDRAICICPPHYTGRRCLIQYDPCINISCNGHGTCRSTEIYHDLDDQFICLCDLGWYGRWCEMTQPRINVSLARDLIFLSSNIVFLHLADIITEHTLDRHDIYLQRFHKDTLNLTFIIDRSETLSSIAFIQFYEHQDKFDYYLLFYHTLGQRPMKEIPVEVQSSHRCRPLHELFDPTILVQPTIRRVKNYQRPCLQHQYDKDPLLCFYDDYLMCICKEDNYTHCLIFQTKLNTCDEKWCNNRGICVKDSETCPTYSQCICEECVYGPFCQFSTGGYTLSLDGIIGSHISLTSLSQQSEVVRIAVGLISTVVVSGIILNMLSILTFIRKETHEVGCGLYLLTSSIVGLSTTIVLLCKMILLLTDKQNNISCSTVEFFLKWCPTSCEWLNACVAFERAVAVKRKIQYSRSKSKYFAILVTPTILILIGCICIPEFFFRGMITDQIDGRDWCVLTLNNEQPGLLTVYSILNILSFVIPLIINLSSGMIIVLAAVESKQKTNDNNVQLNTEQKTTWRRRLRLIRTQILKHKHILIEPVVLGLLSLPRVVLTFIFVCTKLDQNSIPSLIAYLVGFLPSMAIIFAFVCPSKTYRSALLKSIKRIIPKYVLNWSSSSQN